MMSAKVEYKPVLAHDAEMRLERWFKKYIPEMTRGHVEKIIRTGQVRVDGARIKAGFRLQAGQIIRVPPYAPSPREHKASSPPAVDQQILKKVKAGILYQDDHLIVVNKPAGLAVQGGVLVKGSVDGVLSALSFDFPEKPRLVHRLDKDTTGLLLLARTLKAARHFVYSFYSQDVHKVYYALVVGSPPEDHGHIRACLEKRGGAGKEKMEIVSHGKYAETEYKVIGKLGKQLTFLALKPSTGKKHQLRVHCAKGLGTPILGDGKYGARGAFIDQMPVKALHLHAGIMDVPHPVSGRMKFEAPLPKSFIKTLIYYKFDPMVKEDPFSPACD